MIFAAVIVECVFLLFLVTFGWALRSLMLQPGDPEITVRTRTVIANAAWLCLNFSALAAYASRKQGPARRWLAAVLAFDVLNAWLAAAGFFRQSDLTVGLEWAVAALVPATALAVVLMRADIGRLSS